MSRTEMWQTKPAPVEWGKRTELDIMLKMLEIARQPCIQSDMLYGARMNHKTLKRYLYRLFQSHLLESTPAGYRVTERGIALLHLMSP